MGETGLISRLRKIAPGVALPFGIRNSSSQVFGGELGVVCYCGHVAGGKSLSPVKNLLRMTSLLWSSMSYDVCVERNCHLDDKMKLDVGTACGRLFQTGLFFNSSVQGMTHALAQWPHDMVSGVGLDFI